MDETEIFLSYSREDTQKVELILRALQEKGWEVFYDRHIYSGTEWEKVLQHKLEEAYAVVVVWSRHSVTSEWVRREVAAGLAKDRLFPVAIERGIDLPLEAQGKNAVDLSDWNGDADDPKFAPLISAIELWWAGDRGTTRREVTIGKPLVLKKSLRITSRPEGEP
jgi:hypothetical protein